MDLKSCIRDGNLAGALDLAKAGVKAKPTDQAARIALFELLCLDGDLDRAEKHLEFLASGSMELAYATTGLKVVLDAERQRRLVHAGDARPDFFGEKSDWAEPLLSVLAGDEGVADDVEKARPKPKGSLNGKAFSDLRDGDDLLAPLLEVHVAGRYIWLRWDQIRSLTSEPPKTLRETCWLSTKITLDSGNEFDGHMPVLYAGSHERDDGGLQLGHATDWEERGGFVRGVGRRSFFADGEEHDLLAVRELRIGE